MNSLHNLAFFPPTLLEKHFINGNLKIRSRILKNTFPLRSPWGFVQTLLLGCWGSTSHHGSLVTGTWHFATLKARFTSLRKMLTQQEKSGLRQSESQQENDSKNHSRIISGGFLKGLLEKKVWENHRDRAIPWDQDEWSCSHLCLEGTRKGMGFQTFELESHDEKFTLRGAMTIGQSSGSPRSVYRKRTKGINISHLPASQLLMACLCSPLHNLKPESKGP